MSYYSGRNSPSASFLNNSIDVALAASWNTLPESLSYNKTSAFFLVVNHLLPKMESDEIEPVLNWLYRLSIFNREHMDYMLAEHGNDGMERIRDLLKLAKQWRAEDIDDANAKLLAENNDIMSIVRS